MSAASKFYKNQSEKVASYKSFTKYMGKNSINMLSSLSDEDSSSIQKLSPSRWMNKLHYHSENCTYPRIASPFSSG